MTAETLDLFGYSPPIAPDSPRYPNAPGFKGARGGPSEQAARRIAPIVTGRRLEVLNCLAKAPEPLTADQIAQQLQRSPFSIRPRVADLHRMKLVEPVSVRGRNASGMTAHRWRVVPSPQNSKVFS